MTDNEAYDSARFAIIMNSPETYLEQIFMMEDIELVKFYDYVITHNGPKNIINDLECMDVIQRHLNGEDITKPKELSEEEKQQISNIAKLIEEKQFRKKHPLRYKLQKVLNKTKTHK